MSAAGVLEEGAPPWANELASSYVRGLSSVYLLHGNVHDLVPADGTHFVSLEHFLATSSSAPGTWSSPTTAEAESAFSPPARPRGGRRCRGR